MRAFAPAHEAPECVSAILVVEDDALIRLTISDYLQDCGFKVLEASTGDEALGVIATPSLTVDLIFTDVMMPGVTDGFALAQWMKENHPDIPVLVTSGAFENIKMAEEIGGLQFVPKPYEHDAIVDLIRKMLGQPGKS